MTKFITNFCGLMLLLAGCWGSAQGAIQGEAVEYLYGGVKMRGYLAYDDAVQVQRPGILVLHEWWGHNEYARKRARMLARLGYTALAVDMYGEGKQAGHPKDAGRFAAELTSNLAVAEGRFRAALEVLKGHSSVDAQRTGAIGYCLGGGVVLAMARRGVDVDGVVSFHGSLGAGAPAKKNAIKARLLVFNGAADTFVTAEQISAFQEEMSNAAADYQFVNLPGVKHSFTNPEADRFGERFELPLKYDLEADYSSWAEMQVFFMELFKGKLN